MYCRKCGTKLPNDARFCTKCGTPVYDANPTGNSDDSAESADQSQGEPERSTIASDTQGTQEQKRNTQNNANLNEKDFFGQIKDNIETLRNKQTDGGIVEVGSPVRIFALICAVIYIIRIIFYFYNLDSAADFSMSLDIIGSVVELAFTLSDILTIISFALCVLALILLGLCTGKQKAESIYLGVIEACAIRILIATIRLIMELVSVAVFLIGNLKYLVFYYGDVDFFSYFDSSFLVSWILSFVGAAVTVGGLYIAFSMSGFTPFAGKSKEDMAWMSQNLIYSFQKVLKGELSLKDVGTWQIGREAGNSQNAEDSSGSPYYIFGDVPTNRNLLKYIFFNFLTCGMYDIYYRYSLARDLNRICEGDGDHTPGPLVYFGFTLLTCGIYSFVWEFKFADRMANNAQRYGIVIREGGSNVLLWRVFGLFICGVGTYVGVYILLRNLNKLSTAYNEMKNQAGDDTEE